MLSALALLTATNIQGLMADEVQALRSVDPQDLLEIAVDQGVTPPEVLDQQNPDDLDDDFHRDLMLDLARKRVIKMLDALVVLPEPWESASDVLIALAVDEAIGRIDTPEERLALWNKLQQVWSNIGDRVRERRERRQAQRALRGI